MGLQSKAKLGQSSGSCHRAWTRGGEGLDHTSYGDGEDVKGEWV